MSSNLHFHFILSWKKIYTDSFVKKKVIDVDYMLKIIQA